MFLNKQKEHFIMIKKKSIINDLQELKKISIKVYEALKYNANLTQN